MTAATADTTRWLCRPCGTEFIDEAGTQPCPRCGNANAGTIEPLDGLDEQAVEKARAVTKGTVKSAPLVNGKAAKARSKPSAIFRRASLEHSRTGVERITAWIVLLVSVLGTVMALHGGWALLWASPKPIAIVAGVLIQCGLTYVQWAYYHQRTLSWGSRLLDTGLTAIGFGPLLTAPLTQFFVSVGVTSTLQGVPGAVVAAWGAIALASYGLAWYPESRLVD